MRRQHTFKNNLTNTWKRWWWWRDHR
jgi:hypothetical protein